MSQIKVQNNFVQFEIINNLLIATYMVDIITVSIAKSVVKLRLEYTNRKVYPILIKDYTTIKINKEAREYLASEEGSKGIEAVAVLTNSIYKLTLMNFFMKVLPPKMPVKLFSNEKKALQWLNKFKNKSHE